MLLTEPFSAMTHKSPNMNDILSTSVGIGGGAGPIGNAVSGGGGGAAGMLGHLSSTANNDSRNQNQSIPMMRSMSDASDFARRPFPFDFDITSRMPYGLASPGSRIGTGIMSSNLYGIPGATSSSSSSNANSSTTTNSIDFAPSVITPKFLPNHPHHHQNSHNNNNHHSSSAATDPEDDDFDLYMVFDEIGALQNKGLDESEDDSSEIPFSTSLTNSAGSTGLTNSHPPPSATLLSNQLQQLQQQKQQQQQQAQHQQQQQQSVTSAATAPTTTTGGTITNHQSSAAQMHSASTASSATKNYNLEIYDESDIKLSNEKYVLNVRYLKDFRCEQCPLFLQHKCTQHKPFTCFHWHFANQRRRRPLRKRDGTFNYSPDVYCTKYDETTGICPDGDDCPYLHRTAGDTERRYHLRYYKTGMCVYETDSRGFCVKNGPHCAFAHGQHDLRSPVFDVREQTQLSDGGDGVDGSGLNGGHGTGVGTGGNTGGCFDKDRNAVNEDPRWQDTAFVLANYKTELCKRPPRLCRQGYACPQYHNNKDRRRSPKKFKYRSTPCPSVKQGDEWGDPTNCENEDSCSCCHTRTEQQFHPEIYKSTKCNDIQQSNYCPRGPFCAFAHSESSEEINAAREFSMDPNSDIPPSIAAKNGGGGSSSSLSNGGSNTNSNSGGSSGVNNHHHPSNTNNNNNNNHHTSPVDIARANSLSAYSRSNAIAMQQTIASSLPEHFDFGNFDLSAPQPPLAATMAQHEAALNSALCNNNSSNPSSSIGPIARPRSFSTSNTKAVEPMSLSALLEKNNLLKSKAVSGANGMVGSTLFSATSSTSSLFSSLHEHPSQLSNSFGAVPNGPVQNSLQQQQSQNFYGIGGSENLSTLGTFDSVLEDLNLDDFGASSVGDNHLGGDVVNNNSSAINSMLRRSSMLSECSAPINIPVNRIGSSLADARSNSATGFNISPPLPGSANQLGTSSPMGSSFGGLERSSNSFSAGCRPMNIGQANVQSLASAQSFFDSLASGPNPAPAPAAAVPVNLNPNFVQVTMAEMQRLREENSMQKSALANFEEKLSTIVSLCQREINEANKKEKMAEKARDEAINILNSTQQELELLRSNSLESTLIQKRLADISTMSRSQLIQLQKKIKSDLNCIEEVIFYQQQQQNPRTSPP